MNYSHQHAHTHTQAATLSNLLQLQHHLAGKILNMIGMHAYKVHELDISLSIKLFFKLCYNSDKRVLVIWPKASKLAGTFNGTGVDWWPGTRKLLRGMLATSFFCRETRNAT